MRVHRFEKYNIEKKIFFNDLSSKFFSQRMIKLNNFSLLYHISFFFSYIVRVCYIITEKIDRLMKRVTLYAAYTYTWWCIFFTLCALCVNTRIRQFNYRISQVFFLDLHTCGIMCASYRHAYSWATDREIQREIRATEFTSFVYIIVCICY